MDFSALLMPMKVFTWQSASYEKLQWNNHPVINNFLNRAHLNPIKQPLPSETLLMFQSSSGSHLGTHFWAHIRMRFRTISKA